MAKRAPARRRSRLFDIVDPVDGNLLGSNFGVCGNASALAVNNCLAISVQLTLDTTDGQVVRRADAATNVQAETWEAYFADVPPGNNGILTATYTDGSGQHSTSCINLIVEGAVTIGTEITDPDDGDSFPSLENAKASRVYRGRPTSIGSSIDNRQVWAYLTLGGDQIRPRMLVDPNPGGGGSHPHPWKKELRQLAPNAVPGKYGVHFEIEERGGGGRTFRVSRGFIYVG
jgi:hypothetical protein